MTNQELQVWQEFAQWLREKNDRTQEQLQKEEAENDGE